MPDDSSSKGRSVLFKVIKNAGKGVDRLLSRKETGQSNQKESVRPEICIGAVVGLNADAHRHGSGGGVLAGGETGVVISIEQNSKARFFTFLDLSIPLHFCVQYDFCATSQGSISVRVRTYV